MFNHESPRRGGTFVTKKIVNGLCRIKKGLQKTLYLGNLEAKRDWGHAKDYVEMCWKILQYKKGDDFIIATEKQYSVKFFIEKCFQYLGIRINWKGKGLNEQGIDQSGNAIISIDKNYYRPSEVDSLCGDSEKAKIKLNWSPKITFEEALVGSERSAPLQP